MRYLVWLEVLAYPTKRITPCSHCVNFTVIRWGESRICDVKRWCFPNNLAGTAK